MDEDQCTHTTPDQDQGTVNWLLSLCHKKHINIKVNYNDRTIEQVHSAKLLGRHIDSNLTWEE